MHVDGTSATRALLTALVFHPDNPHHLVLDFQPARVRRLGIAAILLEYIACNYLESTALVSPLGELIRVGNS